MADPDILQEAIAFKDKGNELVREKKLDEAKIAYSAAIDRVPANELFWSNRSMVCYQLGDGINALADAERCIAINPNWGRGYSRKVNALQLLGRHEEIIETCKRGLAVERSDALLKNLTIACLELLEGKFWGTTSEAQGAYEQELEFSKEKSVLKVRFFGQEIVCTYRIDPTQSPMTMTIGMPQQPLMLHIFRFTEEGIDLCSPAPSGSNPTSFEGDGFIALKRGPQPEEPEDFTLRELSLPDKLELYAEEAIKIVPNKIEDNQPDAFLKIIHFQKNFYRLRARFGMEVAESMTRLLQGDVPDDVPEGLARRIHVLREKMKDAHLYEDPTGGTEGEEVEDSAGNTARPAINTATDFTATRPTEMKLPTASSTRVVETTEVGRDGEGRKSRPGLRLLVCGLVLITGAVAAGYLYLAPKKGKSDNASK